MTDGELYAEVEIIVRYPGDVRILRFPRIKDFHMRTDRIIGEGDSIWAGHDHVRVTRREDMDVDIAFVGLYDHVKGHICEEENKR